MSTFQRGASPTLSMREKSLLKRRVNKEHNSNFRAGYVDVNEEQLHKTGIRGRKRYVICVVMVILTLTVIVNLMMTVCILSVLGIGREGMSPYLEFIPRGRLLRFLGHTDLGAMVTLTEPVVGSLAGGALDVSGEAGGTVEIKAQSESLRVTPDLTTFSAADAVEILDPDTGAVVFSTDTERQNLAARLGAMERLRADQLLTDRVTSDTRDRLELISGGRGILFGAEGVSVRGRKINVTSRDDLDLWTAGDVELDGSSQTRVVFYRGLPVKPSSAPPRDDVLTYKVCVGAADGTLYSVPWTDSCHRG